MYSKVTCRLIGWTFLFIAVMGFWTGHIGDYMRIQQAESIISLCIGICGVWAARSPRKRNAMAIVLLLGSLLCIWGAVSLWVPGMFVGKPDPLESALRFISGIWAIYLGVQDVQHFRKSLGTS